MIRTRLTQAISQQDPVHTMGSHDEIEALSREVRRLRAQVRRLEEDKKNLEERLAFVSQELERTRARVTGGGRTS